MTVVLTPVLVDAKALTGATRDLRTSVRRSSILYATEQVVGAAAQQRVLSGTREMNMFRKRLDQIKKTYPQFWLDATSEPEPDKISEFLLALYRLDLEHALRETGGNVVEDMGAQ
jgi:hypothetical protein